MALGDRLDLRVKPAIVDGRCPIEANALEELAGLRVDMLLGIEDIGAERVERLRHRRN